MRGHRRPVSARNIVNGFPDAVVDTLLKVAEQNAPVLQRLFRMKARLLGMQKLRRYDLYAPIAHPDSALPIEQAAALMIQSFREFHPRFGNLPERTFRENHIDNEVRKN